MLDEKDRLYGQLVVDFANATSPEKAGLKYFENIQKVFNFSPQFTVKAQSKFPRLSHLQSSFNRHERELFELCCEIRNLLETEDSLFPNISFIGFDECFLDNTIMAFVGSCPSHPQGAICLIEIEQSEKNNIEKLKVLFDAAVEKEVSSEEKPKIFDEYLKYTERYIELNNKLWDLKKHFREDNFSQICGQAKYYYADFLPEYKHINIVKEQLNSCLEFIIDRSCDDKKNGLKHLTDFALFYNNIKRPGILITPGGDIVKENLYNEDFFMKEDRQHYSKSLRKYYDEIIAYCMCEYLISAGKENMLKKCPYCAQFYIAKKYNPRQKFCSDCSPKNKMTSESWAKYQRDYRASPARKKAIENKKHEEKIQHLMVNAGKTRKQAEQIVDDDA